MSVSGGKRGPHACCEWSSSNLLTSAILAHVIKGDIFNIPACTVLKRTHLFPTACV